MPCAARVEVLGYFIVRRAKGPSWDHSKLRRQQAGWDEHAVFMDALTEEGFVVLGGPVGEGDGEDAVNVVAADGVEEVRARLAEDPWGEDMLETKSIEPWTILLRGRAAPATD
jgi:uncharacterized protein YciI